MTDERPPRGKAPTKRTERDPLGKRALFSAVADTEVGDDREDMSPPLGKLALFSAAAHEHEPEADPEPTAPVVVTCQRCGVTSRISFLALLLCQFPVGIWLPGRKFDHRMTCPACSKWAWASVTLQPGRWPTLGAFARGIVKRSGG